MQHIWPRLCKYGIQLILLGCLLFLSACSPEKQVENMIQSKNSAGLISFVLSTNQPDALRLKAAQGLAVMHDISAIPVLLKMENDPLLGLAVKDGLSRFTESDVVNIQKFLSKTDEAQSAIGLEMFGRIGGDSAAEQAYNCLSFKCPESLGQKAVDTLLKIGNAKAVHWLQWAATTGSAREAGLARNALLAWKNPLLMSTMLDDLGQTKDKKKAQDAAGWISRMGEAGLMEVYNKKSWLLREKMFTEVWAPFMIDIVKSAPLGCGAAKDIAIDWLGNMQYSAAEELIGSQLDQPGFCLNAITALGRLGSVKYTEKIEKLYFETQAGPSADINTDPGTRLIFLAGQALGLIGDRAATGRLIELVSSNDKVHSNTALDTLAVIYKNDSSALWPYLKNPKLMILYKSIMATGDKQADEPLIQALQQYNDLKMATDYLNSGRPGLEQAAKVWAKAHGYVLMPGPAH